MDFTKWLCKAGGRPKHTHRSMKVFTKETLTTGANTMPFFARNGIPILMCTRNPRKDWTLSSLTSRDMEPPVYNSYIFWKRQRY